MSQTFRTYLQAKINIKKKSIPRFIKEIGFYNSKFYKYVDEPSLFSDAELDEIADVLELSVPEKEELFSLAHGQSFHEKESAIKTVEKLFCEPTFTVLPPSTITLFDDRSKTKSEKASFKEVFSEWQKSMPNIKSVEISIYDCMSGRELTSVYSILSSIYYCINDTDMNTSVHIQHITPVDFDFFDDNHIDERFNFYLQMVPLMRFSDYRIFLLQQIKQREDTSKERSFILAKIIYNSDNNSDEIEELYCIIYPSTIATLSDNILLTQDNFIFQFHETRFNNMNMMTEILTASIEIDELLFNQEAAKSGFSDTVNFGADPCIFELPPEIWERLFDNMSDEDKRTLCVSLGISDSQYQIPNVSCDFLIKQQLYFLKRRFENSVDKNNITIIDLRGFLNFIRTGKLRDLGSVFVVPEEQRREILKYFIDWLTDQQDDNNSGHRFYFADLYKPSQKFGYYCTSYVGYGVCIVYSKLYMGGKPLLVEDRALSLYIKKIIIENLYRLSKSKEDIIFILKGLYDTMISSNSSE